MSSDKLITLADGTQKSIERASRKELLGSLSHYKDISDEWLRRMIIDKNRIDILANEVLGYTLQPFHVKMLKFQFEHPKSLQLAYRGSGKSCTVGTKVIRHDGTVDEIQNIKVGDQLMGPDSKPRTVLNVQPGRGPMYEIRPTRSKPWQCNDAHILTLKGRQHKKGQIIDVPIRDYIDRFKHCKRGLLDTPWKQFHVPVDFPEKPLEFDPYLIGLWLGDGTSSVPQITNPEVEIEDWLYTWSHTAGYAITKSYSSTGCQRYYIKSLSTVNHLLRFLESMGPEKHVPRHYITNSEEKRLQLLAGLVDTDGYYDKLDTYEICQKHKHLAEDIAFLARSLGFFVSLNEKIGTIKYEDGTLFRGLYYRLYISGNVDRIPCKVKRKQAKSREINKDPLVEGFDAVPIGDGDYYGVLLDGDGRFLLEDFTVTHNSTSCTITKAIHLLIKDRNLRILLVSKTKGNAENFLKEIKTHLESNEKLIKLFGEFYDPHKVSKWDNSEIEILGRTKVVRESSVSCLGVDSAIVSRHYDVILCDDLVEEENARTKHLRDKTKTWFYQTLDPTLEPPDKSISHRGEMHFVGTRYHYDDFYGHLMENELKGHTQIIPALDEHGNSPWPERHPPEWFLEKKRNAGAIVYGCQYLCQTEQMKGEIFKYDDCQRLPQPKFPNPKELKIFMGVDLAIKESESADQFALVVIGIEGDMSKDDCRYYILDSYAKQIRFSKQTDLILSKYNEWDPILCVIESNAYQLAQIQTLKDHNAEMRVHPHITDKDKMTRAWKLSPLFEQGRMFFKEQGQEELIDQLVLFPSHRYKDLFDALDLAVTASKIRRRKRVRKDREEPGIISVRKRGI